MKEWRIPDNVIAGRNAEHYSNPKIQTHKLSQLLLLLFINKKCRGKKYFFAIRILAFKVTHVSCLFFTYRTYKGYDKLL